MFPPSLLLTDELVVVLLIIFRFSTDSTGSTDPTGSTGSTDSSGSSDPTDSRYSDRPPGSGFGWSQHSSPVLLLSLLILVILFKHELR